MDNLITPGTVAPDFALEDVNGELVRLSDFRGKPVVLAFLRGFM
jgi:peroxiredoxin